MHPPWITFKFILLLSAIASSASGDEEENEAVNATASRPQREIYERERRLIPYMTYYVTQSLTSADGGAKQSILVPVTSPRGNIFRLDPVPKIQPSNIHYDNPQATQVLPKPVLRLTSPAYITPTIQVGQYKAKEGIFPQIYRLETGVNRPRIQTQQIQSETQPLQVVKVNPVPTAQKYDAPRIIKIIPVIAKLPPPEGSPGKSFEPPQPRFAYPGESLRSLPPHPSTADYRTYYKEPVPPHVQTSLQEKQVYASHVPGQNAPLAPDGSKYAIAKIVFATTTPTPYENVKLDADHGGGTEAAAAVAHLGRPSQPRLEYDEEAAAQGFHTPTPGPGPLVYGQRANAVARGREPQYLIRSEGEDRLPKLRVPEEEKIRFVASVTPVPVTNDLESAHWKVNTEGQIQKNYDGEALNNIFALLKETNKLPQNLTPDNIDTGIKTLALILERLQRQRNSYRAQANPSPATTAPEPLAAAVAEGQNPKKIHNFPEKSGTSTPGRPGIDYPTYSTIPQTNFDCSTQRYKGFFGDPDTKCQVWHYCDLNGGQASFLCPNGTIFSQVALTCDWWFNVKCASTSQLYVLNERLYKYILPFSPSFPEDYSGPVVDTYLEAKFKEMEAKAKLKALKSLANSTTTERSEVATEAPTNSPTEFPTQGSEA